MAGEFTQAYDKWRTTGDVSIQFGDVQPQFVPLGPNATLFATDDSFAEQAEEQLEGISEDTDGDPDR